MRRTGASISASSGDAVDLTPGDGVLYSAGDTGVISLMDPVTDSVQTVTHASTDNAGSYPHMAVGAHYVWVANGGESSVLALDPVTLEVVQEVTVGSAPPSDGTHLPGSRSMNSAFGYIWTENSNGNTAPDRRVRFLDGDLHRAKHHGDDP